MTGLKIDPHASWGSLRLQAEQTSSERQKKLLNGVADHMEAEIKGQLEPLMATLTAEPIYHFWRVGNVNMILNGYEEVSSFYTNMFTTGGEQFEVVVERIIVDDVGVITEGQVKQVYTSESLRNMGLTAENISGLEDHDLWFSNTQLITVWPADPEAKLVGEDIYFGEDPMKTLQPITRDEIPDYYKL